MNIFKREDWDRRRTEYVDKNLLTIINGYEPGKIIKGII